MPTLVSVQVVMHDTGERPGKYLPNMCKAQGSILQFIITQWLTTLMPTLRKLKQEQCHKLKNSSHSFSSVWGD